MSNWVEKVDFAFVAEDEVSSLSLMYVESKFVPNAVRNVYTEITYNIMTEFIIDEIPGNNSGWPKSDLSRGFYVYEYVPSMGFFKKIGNPSISIKSEKLLRFKSHIISFQNISFNETNELLFK
jgi:hypothetical protein